MSEMDGIIELLNRLSPSDREEALAFVAASREDLAWVPNPGPQTTAYFSQADEVFYGGQAGGGKTDLILGLALTAHTKSLVLRRTNREVNGLIERMTEILGSRDGFNSQNGYWRYKHRLVELGGCQMEEDKQKYKGNAKDLYCVGRDTPVLMADGRYTPVQEIRVGDTVATLEGPRKIKNAFKVHDRESVTLTVNTPEGVVTQVQSASHKVLSRTEWVSPDTPSDDLPWLVLSDTKVCRDQHRSSSNTSNTLSSTARAQDTISQSVRSIGLPPPNVLGTLCQTNRRGLTADRALPIQGNDSARSDGARQEPWPNRTPLRALLTLFLRSMGIAPTPYVGLTHPRGVFGAPNGSSLPDFLDDYPSCLHSYGAHIPPKDHHALKGDRSDLLRSHDVAPRSPIYSPTDAGGDTHTRSYPPQEYPHPYTKGKRLSQLPLNCVPCEYASIGKLDLFDLEVEEVNHFITFGGIVNKNCFDELSDFTESQYIFITGWNRSTIPGQRCRVIGAGNPPTRPEGQWVVRRWAAWLDPQHPNPAEPGELRWYTTDNMGEEVEVDGPGPHYLNSTEPLYARSRTFIPAELADNPDLVGTGYQASLDSLPAELRAAYRDGNFQAGISDDAYQLIPSAWVVAAQARWTPNPPIGVPMCAIGCDVAVSKDKFVLAPRHDTWFAKTIVIPGREVADAKQAAGRVMAIRRDNARVIVDVGGGWGADCFGQLMANNIDSLAYMGVKTSRRKTTDGKFSFFNVRTEALWKLREALDPSQPGGSAIQLPPGSSIRADLCAPHYLVKKQGNGVVIMAESKEDICDKLGRSPDEGDAIVMSWYDGLKVANVPGGWEGGRSPGNVTVNRGKRYH